MPTSCLQTSTGVENNVNTLDSHQISQRMVCNKQKLALMTVTRAPFSAGCSDHVQQDHCHLMNLLEMCLHQLALQAHADSASSLKCSPSCSAGMGGTNPPAHTNSLSQPKVWAPAASGLTQLASSMGSHDKAVKVQWDLAKKQSWELWDGNTCLAGSLLKAICPAHADLAMQLHSWTFFSDSRHQSGVLFL